LTTKRRIMIMTKDEINEINDENLMSEFMETPGKYIETFYINKDRMKRFLSVIGHGNDWTLYDNEILFQYDKNARVMRIYFIDDRETKTVIDMFQELDNNQKDNTGAYEFHLLTCPNGKYSASSTPN